MDKYDLAETYENFFNEENAILMGLSSYESA